MDSEVKHTPLYNEHVALGGHMVSFAGWMLPTWYPTGLIAEHKATRSEAGLFDVSHMGEVEVTGPEAEKALSYLCCNDVTKLVDGKAQYSAITSERGGLIDDIIIYRFKQNHYLVCVNASNSDKDFAWFTSKNTFEAKFVNVSSKWGQIALQGPKAIAIYEDLVGKPIDISPFSFALTKFSDYEVMVARTGYTGEDGVEIFVPWQKTPHLWSSILEVGKDSGLIPCGLGARDSLRLEACLPLYGHELQDDVSAVESGIGSFVKISDREFLGRSVLKDHKENGAPRSLVAFFVEDPRIVREGTEIFSNANEKIGFVTSGTRTPTLDKPLGLAVVDSKFSKLDTEFFAEVRGKRLPCRVTKRPFYKRSN